MVRQWKMGKKGNKLMDDDNLITVAQFCEKYPWPTQPAMRSYIMKAKKLGLEDAFVHFSSRVLVNPKIFFTCVKNSNLPNTKKRKK